MIKELFTFILPKPKAMKRIYLTFSLIVYAGISFHTAAQTKYAAHIKLPDPLPTPSICMVMIDPDTEKNMIIWEKAPDPLVKQYQVLRISGADYSLVSTSSEADTSTTIDWSSKPGAKTDAYCLVSIDTCGNTTQKSPWHKPFLLQTGIGLNNVINLNWQSYLVDGTEYIFKSIVIYRGTDSTKLVPIDTISAGIGSVTYTDENPPLNVNVYYRIGGEKEVPCDPNHISGKKISRGPYVHSLSNLEDNRLSTTHITGSVSEGNIEIYPNPMKTETRIFWNNPDGVNYGLFIYDLKGTLIRSVSGLDGMEYIILRENLESGCYILELRGSRTYHGRLLVN
jgi:hypothetical protein